MTLPEPGTAQNWVGRAVVDREGVEIGACRAVLSDDDTGLPEWLYVDVDGTTVTVPLLGAVEAGERVQVTVSRADAGTAPPPAGDTQHLSAEEEAALYGHYGIEYSRAVSDTGLPADAPLGTSDGEAGATRPDIAHAVRRVLPGVAAALAGLGLLVAVVLGLRRRRSRPASGRAGRWVQRRTRAGAASAGRAASAAARSAGVAARGAGIASLMAVALTKDLVAASAPLASATGRGLWQGSTVALHAADATIRRSAAAVPPLAARVVQAGQTGLGAAAKVAGAVGSGAEVITEAGEQLHKGWTKAMSRLSLGLGFGLGYVIGARAGRARFEQIKRAAESFAQRPQVQQAVGKAKEVVPATLQSSTGALFQRASDVTSKVRRRSAGGGAVHIVGSPPATPADTGRATPSGSAPPPEPFGAPGVSDDGSDGPPLPTT